MAHFFRDKGFQHPITSEITPRAVDQERRQILRAREEYLHWRELQHQLQGLTDTTRSSSLPSVKALLNHLVSGGKLEYR